MKTCLVICSLSLFLLNCSDNNSTEQPSNGDSVLTTSPATDPHADPGNAMANDTVHHYNHTDTLRNRVADSARSKK